MVKIMIETPYPIDSNEHGNFMGMLKEINQQNNDAYKIDIVSPLKCDECGSINETVARDRILDVNLCDYCAKDLEG